ncbi:MAG: FkbM family methyltransferase [Rhizobacter sp.]|nr:FkbM family methyltransferase [Chlorobiales bacterium]
MHVEECSQALLARWLPAIDEHRAGMCIDIGVGTFAFYCELFSRLGFKTAAVEPLPIDHVRKFSRVYGIRLLETCISEIDGTQTIYIGTYDGKELFDVSSLKQDWWGSSGRSKQVQSMTVATLLQTLSPERLTCVKIDVEGLEPVIIRQFAAIKNEWLPEIIVFEYGGGSTKEEGKEGWSAEGVAGTLECLEVLKQRGYDFSVMLDSAAGTAPRTFHLRTALLNPDDIFFPKGVYGNLLCARRAVLSETQLAEICNPYLDNAAAVPPLQLTENVLTKTFRKVAMRLL